MPPGRKLGSSRAAGSPARPCPSVVLIAAAAGAELLHRPERKMGRTVASRATERLHPRTQAKTPDASRTWRDTRPRAAKAGSSRGRALEFLSAMAASFPLYARWAPDIRRPRAAHRDQGGGLPRRPRTRVRFRRPVPKLQKRPAYLPC